MKRIITSAVALGAATLLVAGCNPSKDDATQKVKPATEHPTASKVEKKKPTTPPPAKVTNTKKKAIQASEPKGKTNKPAPQVPAAPKAPKNAICH